MASGRRSVAEAERKHHRGALCGAFQREGGAAWGLPRRLRSKGDAGLALKPPVAKVDGRERLDGRVGQCQLSSQFDDEIQVTEMHACARDLADCVVSHPWPDLERTKSPT